MRSIRKRRLQSKTDYKARLTLLTSGKPRLVIRKTNRYIIVQIVETHVAQDKVVMQMTSKDLLDKGWPKEKAGSLKSRPAAYLTGYMLGHAAKAKVKHAILDIGMYRNIHGSRLYAALKGVVDSGLDVPHSEEVLPSMELIEADANLKSIVAKIKQHK